MKYRIIFALALSVFCISAQAETPRRDAIMERLESLYLSAVMFSPDSPLLGNMLEPAIRANPNVKKEEWSKVSSEVASALTQLFTAKGGLMDVAFRASVAGLTDDELVQLERLLSDPVYRKFQQAASAPQTQRQVMQAVMGAALGMQDELNAVLSRHGMKEIH